MPEEPVDTGSPVDPKEQEASAVATDALTKAATDDKSADLKLRANEEGADTKNVNRARAILTVILVILIILLFLACGLLYNLLKPGGPIGGKQGGNGIIWIRSIYGFGDEPDQLMHPSDVAVSPDGNSFWVTDANNFRLIEYYMNGGFKRLVTKDAAGDVFNYPTRITVAPNGYIIVAEQTYDLIRVYDTNFNVQYVLNVDEPQSVAANNEMLVVGSRGGFAAFNIDGSFIGQLGQQGTGDDDFDLVSGLALDADNNVYVLDAYNNRLSKYDEAGDKVWMVSLGYPGNGGITGGRDEDEADLEKKYPANMQVPESLCIDDAGRIVVIDLFDFSVAAFKPEDGTFIKKWGEYGREDGYFSYPSAVAYNRAHDAYLAAEPVLGRVQIFELDGSSGSGLGALRRRLSDLLSACCIPLIIILILLAAYIISRIIAKRRREREALADVDPQALQAAGIEAAKPTEEKKE